MNTERRPAIRKKRSESKKSATARILLYAKGHGHRRVVDAGFSSSKQPASWLSPHKRKFRNLLMIYSNELGEFGRSWFDGERFVSKVLIEGLKTPLEFDIDPAHVKDAPEHSALLVDRIARQSPKPSRTVSITPEKLFRTLLDKEQQQKIAEVAEQCVSVARFDPDPDMIAFAYGFTNYRLLLEVISVLLELHARNQADIDDETVEVLRLAIGERHSVASHVVLCEAIRILKDEPAKAAQLLTQVRGFANIGTGEVGTAASLPSFFFPPEVQLEDIETFIEASEEATISEDRE